MSNTTLQKVLAQNKATQASHLDLGNLDLDGTESELAELQHFTWVESISFSSFWEEFDFATRKNVHYESKNESRTNELVQLPILPTQLKKLVVGFDIRGQLTSELRNIAHIAHLTSLEFLMIDVNDEADMRYIANLTALKYLMFYQYQDSDYLFLKNLTMVEFFSFGNNSITDFEFIGYFSNLKHLRLSARAGNINISFLKNLIKLEYLNFENNRIVNIDDLSALVNLKELNMCRNSVININVLKNLKNLEILNLKDNPIENFMPINSLSSLKILEISGKQIDNIDFLFNLVKLEDLCISFKSIGDLDALEKLQNLRNLEINCNNLQNIDSLKNLTGLEDFLLNDSDVEDISFLHNFKNIKKITLWGNHKLENISILSGFQSLESLHLIDLNSKERLHKQDLVLFDLPNLEELYISDNKIDNVYIKKNVGKLTKITIQGDIKNIVFEEVQENITKFYLNENRRAEIDFVHILESMPNLVKLEFYNGSEQPLENINIINNLKKLKEINLTHFTITQSFFLHSLPNLEEISISDSQVDTIRIGGNLKNLKRFYFCHSTIKEIIFDSIQEKLKSIYVKNNKLTNVDFLAYTPHVESLYFNGNAIKNLEPLKKCVKYMYIGYLEQISSPPLWFIKAQARKKPFKYFAEVENPPFFDKICQMLSTQEAEFINLACQLAVSQSWNEEDIADCKTYFAPKED